MDLRNNQITVGEILDYPPAMAVFRRRFGQWANHPMIGKNRSLTLAKLIPMASVIVPKQVIQETIQELKNL